MQSEILLFNLFKSNKDFSDSLIYCRALPAAASLTSVASAQEVAEEVAKAGGHAVFRSGNKYIFPKTDR